MITNADLQKIESALLKHMTSGQAKIVMVTIRKQFGILPDPSRPGYRDVLSKREMEQ